MANSFTYVLNQSVNHSTLLVFKFQNNFSVTNHLSQIKSLRWYLNMAISLCRWKLYI